MDAKNEYNLSTIETKVNEILRGEVSPNVFFGTLPSVLKEEWSEMVLIDFDSEIEDMNAYAIGVVHVVLYARPLSDGTKNVAVISNLEKNLNAAINKTKESMFQISRARMSSDFDTNINWHCVVVTLNIKVY